MNTTQEELELAMATGNAVKSNLKNSNALVRWLNNRDDKKNTWILNKLNDNDKWNYVIEFQVKMTCDSMTTIGDYTNKKGHVSKAHFNGCSYHGSCRKLGMEPVPCQSWCVPNRKDWTIRNGAFVRK